MPRPRTPFLAAALALLATPSLSLTVSESVVGDFDTTNDFEMVTDDIGTLDLGLNTVSGSIDTTCQPDTPTGFICVTGPDYSDAFLMTIGQRERLASVLMTTKGTAPMGYTPAFGMVERTTGTFVHSDSLTAFNATGAIIDGLPVGAGTYVFGIGQGLATSAGRPSTTGP